MKHNEKFNFTQARHQTSSSKLSFSFRTQIVYVYAMKQGQVISAHPLRRCIKMVTFECVTDIGERNVSLHLWIAEVKYPSSFKKKPVINLIL